MSKNFSTFIFISSVLISTLFLTNSTNLSQRRVTYTTTINGKTTTVTKTIGENDDPFADFGNSASTNSGSAHSMFGNNSGWDNNNSGSTTSSTNINNSVSNDNGWNLENNFPAPKPKKLKKNKKQPRKKNSLEQTTDEQPAHSAQPAQDEVEKTTSSGCNYLVKGFTEEEKAIMVQAHNEFRNKVALQQTQYGVQLPFATNMKQMYWDEEMAANAQKHTDKCEFAHSSNDERVLGSRNLGENIATSSSSLRSDIKTEMKNSVTNWNSEIKEYVEGGYDVSKFTSSRGPVVGHFTQCNWAESYALGCGFIFYKKDGNYSQLTVCQYYASGNFMNDPIYQQSNRSGCECSSGYSCSNKDYPGLCCAEGKCSKNSIKLN